MNLLLNERNVIMANKIATAFSKKPAESHFIIAGSLHYIGDGNVIELLRKKGYIVSRQK